MAEELFDVVEITGSGKALAARRADGKVIAWGSEDCGGDSSEVQVGRWEGWFVIFGIFGMELVGLAV